MAFGGLLEVARPLLARIDELPERQAAALRAALALDDGPSPDRLTVGAATLSLLAAAAEETPLLVALDDAHWLDAESAAALGFAVRRLQAERVAVVCATRVGEGRGLDPAGLVELDLSGLSREDAGELLARNGVPGAEAATRFHALTGGNPLALLELPQGFGDDEAPGGGGPGEPVRIGERLEAAFAARADALPDTTREALLVLAASSTEDAAPIIAALEAGGLTAEHLVPAEDAGLIESTLATIRFRHPLVRSALYHAAAPSTRRAAHSALASALEERDPEGAAWHRAAAATGPDATVADALERTGERSGAARGVVSRIGRVRGRCAAFDAPPPGRARRLQLAARQAWLAGQVGRAQCAHRRRCRCVRRRLVSRRAPVPRRRDRAVHRPTCLAHRMLVDAAALAAPLDPTRAALMLGEATDACLHLDDQAYLETTTAFGGLPFRQRAGRVPAPDRSEPAPPLRHRCLRRPRPVRRRLLAGAAIELQSPTRPHLGGPRALDPRGLRRLPAIRRRRRRARP